MKIQIAKKWKWFAIDKNGTQVFFTHKPTPILQYGYWDHATNPNAKYIEIGINQIDKDFLLDGLKNVYWRKSLLKRVGDDWVQVIEGD